jgi:endonuclease/exonuclease/phosphatase family metal-dependent hydrolase
MRWLTSFLEWVNLFLVLATIMCYFSPFISPATFWPASFIGLAYPWLLLANILFIGLWAFTRSKFAFLSIVCLAIGWNHIQSIVGFNTQLPTAKDDIGIMTFNVYGFRKTQDFTTIEQQQLSKALDVKAVDIICFQEFPGIPQSHPINQYFIKENGLKYTTELPAKGISIFSRYPIINSKTEHFSNGANGYQYVDIRLDTTIIRVFNIHLQSNAVSGIANVVAEEGNLQEKETWLNIRGMMAQYKRTAIKRAKQAEEVAKVVRESPHPVILCGDFNDIPQSYIYKTLAAGLQDSFREKGRGLGITYSGKIPALRIDYILASPELEIRNFKVGEKNFSDHFPVFSTVR